MANSRFLKNLELAMLGTRTISVDSLLRGNRELAALAAGVVHLRGGASDNANTVFAQEGDGIQIDEQNVAKL